MPAPANDNCSGAITIASLPYASGAIAVDDATAGPSLTCESNPAKTIWFKWVATFTGRIVYDATETQDWGVVIGVFTGADCASLVEVACVEQYNEQSGIDVTSGTTYWFVVGTYDDAPNPQNISFNVAVANPGSTSGFAVAQIAGASRNLALTWTSSGNRTRIYIERCHESGCTDFAEITNLGSGLNAYTDRGLTGGELYRYKIRTWHPAHGYGAYSSIQEATTVAGSEGVVQQGFCIEMVGSFNRMQSSLVTSPTPLSGVPLLRLGQSGDLYIYRQANEQTTTQPGGAGHSIYSWDELIIWYRDSRDTSGYRHAETTNNPLGLEVTCIDFPFLESQVQAQDVNHKLEIVGRYGSVDSLTKTHKADGWFQAWWNGVKILEVTGIALGWNGSTGISGGLYYIHPGAAYNIAPGAGGCNASQNTGLKTLKISSVASRPSSGNIFNYTDFALYGNSNLFFDLNAANPWQRFDNFGSSTSVPTVLTETCAAGPAANARLSDSACGSFALGYIRNVAANTTPPTEYCPSCPQGPPGICPDGSACPEPENGGGGGGGNGGGGGGGESETGTVVVKKVVAAAYEHDVNDIVFDYTASIPTAQAGTIRNGETDTFSSVAVGSGYSVVEAPKSNWTTTYSVSPTSAGSNESFAVASGQTVTVTITNTFVPTNIAGIYVIEPNKTEDTLWVDDDFDDKVDVKIPDPFVRGFLLGD